MLRSALFTIDGVEHGLRFPHSVLFKLMDSELELQAGIEDLYDRAANLADIAPLFRAGLEAHRAKHFRNKSPVTDEATIEILDELPFPTARQLVISDLHLS